MRRRWAEAAELQRGAEALNNVFQVRLAHEAKGAHRIAEEGSCHGGRRNSLLLPSRTPTISIGWGVAYRELGKEEEARRFFKAAAQFNGLPQLNYAFIRSKARVALAKQVVCRPTVPRTAEGASFLPPSPFFLSPLSPPLLSSVGLAPLLSSFFVSCPVVPFFLLPSSFFLASILTLHPEIPTMRNLYVFCFAGRYLPFLPTPRVRDVAHERTLMVIFRARLHGRAVSSDRPLPVYAPMRGIPAAPRPLQHYMDPEP